MKNKKMLLILTVLMSLQSANSDAMAYASRMGRNLGMAAAAAYAGSSFTSRAKCEPVCSLQDLNRYFKSSRDYLKEDDLVSCYEHDEYLRIVQPWVVAEGEKAAAARLAQPKVFDEKATRVLREIHFFMHLDDHTRETMQKEYGIQIDSHVAAIRYLFNLGADFNAQDHVGQTVLHRALMDRAPIETIKHLHEAGAKLDIRDKYGIMPISFARNEETIDYFIAAGFDIHVKDDHGRTLLFTGSARSNVYNYFIKLGVDVNAKDKDGKSLLHHKLWPHTYVKLIESGADLYAVDNSGKIPLDHKEVRDAAYKLGKISKEVYEELNVKAKLNEEAKKFSAMTSTPIGQAWLDLERYALENN